MKLSDVMSHANLAFYAEVAMLIFMATFIGIVIWLFWPSRRDALERHRSMPLSDEGRRPSQGGARR
jgi:cbb3-type cytochrome oxidase subunit 3